MNKNLFQTREGIFKEKHNHTKKEINYTSLLKTNNNKKNPGKPKKQMTS